MNISEDEQISEFRTLIRSHKPDLAEELEDCSIERLGNVVGIKPDYPGISYLQIHMEFLNNSARQIFGPTIVVGIVEPLGEPDADEIDADDDQNPEPEDNSDTPAAAPDSAESNVEIGQVPLEEPTVEASNNHRGPQPENDAGSASDEESPIGLFLDQLGRFSPLGAAMLREEGEVVCAGGTVRLRVPAGTADCYRADWDQIEAAAQECWEPSISVVLEELKSEEPSADDTVEATFKKLAEPPAEPLPQPLASNGSKPKAAPMTNDASNAQPNRAALAKAPPAINDGFFDELKADPKRYFEQILGERLEKKAGQRESVTKCPFHEDRKPSLRVNFDKLAWFCDPCQRGGGIMDLAKEVWGCDFKEAKNRLVPKTKPKLATIVRTIRYPIRDLEGEIQATHIRHELSNGDKSMPWEPSGVKPTELPLFQIEKTFDSADRDPIILCEGEKPAAKLWPDWLAVGTVCGARQTPCDEILKPLLRLTPYLWPDNDDVGREHMRRIGERLLALGHTEVRQIRWPEAPPKGDAADFEGDVGVLIDAAERFVNLPAPLGQQLPATRAVLLVESSERAVVSNQEYVNRPSIVDRLLYTQQSSLTVGGKHEGKTTVSITEALSIAAGRDVYERHTIQTPVIYACSSEEYATTRMNLLTMGWDERKLPLILSKIKTDENPEPEEIFAELARLAEAEGARYIVLDMLFDFIRVQDENKYAQTRAAVGLIQTLADEIKGHVRATHHSPKWMPDAATAAKAALGSQGIAARFSPIMLRRKWADDLYTVESTMTRDPRGMAISPSVIVRDENGWTRLDGEFKQWMKWKMYVDRILGLFDGQDGVIMSVRQVSEALTVSKHEVANALLQMTKQQADGKPGVLDRRRGKGNSYLYFVRGSNLFNGPPQKSD